MRHFVVILDDGETFSDLEGCVIMEVTDDTEDDTEAFIEEQTHLPESDRAPTWGIKRPDRDDDNAEFDAEFDAEVNREE